MTEPATAARAGHRPQLCVLDVDGCLLDEWRFFDPATQQGGYEIVCLNDAHKQRCPREGEMFRLAPRG
jgi:hypothetical protein